MDAFRDIEAVVFDVGGTLLDFDQPETLAQLSDGILAAYEHLDQAGAKLPSLRRYSGILRRKALLSLIMAKLRGREPDTMHLLREAHAALAVGLDDAALHALSLVIYAPTKTLAHAKPHTAAALAELRARGYRLAIVSNTVAPPPGLDEHLADEGLLEFFDIRVYSCVFGVPKPNRRIFDAVLQELGLPAERAVYVGDRPEIDVRGAKRAGMRTVLRMVNSQPAPRQGQPDAVIREIPDLLALFPQRTPT
jgi:putative hydrolase of the HAD superfamily